MKTESDLVIEFRVDTGKNLTKSNRLAANRDVRAYIHWLEERLLAMQNKKK